MKTSGEVEEEGGGGGVHGRRMGELVAVWVGG